MPDLYLHNTLSRQKEKFEPLDASNVRMYVCGPTVYDYVHIGNARPIVVFDTLYRLLKRLYPRVTYARNITDVDDKIMDRAKMNNEPIEKLTKRTTKAFHDDISHLNALLPDIEPRATQYIAEMIALCQTLIEKGHAYAAEGHVLFHVPSMPDYGRLSRHSRDELVAGARVEVAPYKKDPTDFVLWKPSDDDQVGWESPWGRGRPGWHIECSAMSKKNLGETFDIHAGGLDLIFPHHENEIAQSTCANGAPMANYWVHNGFLTINGEKMSKSLKNFHTIHEILEQAPGEALRLALLSGQYRQPLDFSFDSLQQAKATLDRWYGALRPLAAIQVQEIQPTDEFETALCDDLNTPMAISYVHNLVGELNKATSPKAQAKLKAELLACGHAIGVLYKEPEEWFKGEAKDGHPTDAEIDALIEARLAARKAKDFAEADRLRKQLTDIGIILEDSPKGTTWRRT